MNQKHTGEEFSMSFLSHHTLAETALQESLTAAWGQEIVPLLPDDLEEFAWRLGATVRKGRKIHGASDLLRGILVYTLCSSSFRDVGAWGVLSGVADMAGTSWRDRMMKSSDWLCWLLNELTKPERHDSYPRLKKAGYEKIELVDASHWTCTGKRGKVWRFHCMYSLCTQQLHQVMVSTTKVAENMSRFHVEAGTIYVHDGGYGYRGQIASIVDEGAHSVSAFCPGTFPVEDAEGRTIDLVGWLKKQRARRGEIKSLTAFFWQDGKRYEIRVVGVRRKEEQKKRILQKKKRRATKNHVNLQKETEYLAGWMLVLTTLPASDWSAQEILSLYRARWQIEIFFKRIKQLLDHHILRVKTDQAAKAMVAAILVGWVLQHDVASEMRSLLEEVYHEIGDQEGKEKEKESIMQIISEWRIQQVSTRLFRQNIQGSLTRQRILECLPKLKRHLGDSPRKRTHEWYRATQYLVNPKRSENSLGEGKSRNTGSALTSALA